MRQRQGARFGVRKEAAIIAAACLLAMLAFRFVSRSELLTQQSVKARNLPRIEAGVLDDAERTWTASDVDDYDLKLTFVAQATTSDIELRVRDGEAIYMIRNGIEETNSSTRNQWTIDAQFRQIREMLGEDQVYHSSAKEGTQMHMYGVFDSTYGYPEDYARFGYGSAVTYHVMITSLDVMAAD